MSNKGLFDSPAEADESIPVITPESSRKRATSHIEHRSNTLNNLVAGNVEDKTLLWVDPSECRMWAGHNRRYDLLSINDAKVAELVEGLKAQGRQEIPAVVRAVNDESVFKYEVIAGARRHWAIAWLRENNYPSFKFLIDVRDMTDEECFRFADLENRERDDVSDYERAIDYKRAINLYYGGVDSRMAERIGYTRANLSYLLRLADLADEIIEAFGDPRRITVNNGRELTPLLKASKTRRKVLQKAVEIAEQQKARGGENLLDSKEVMKRLKAAVKQKAAKAEPKQYMNKNGSTVIRVDKNNLKEIKVTLNRGQGITNEEFHAALDELLSEYL